MLQSPYFAFLILGSTLLPSPAKAIDIISSFPSNNGTTASILPDNFRAVGFTMPNGLPYTLDSATARLIVSDTLAQSSWSFSLFPNISGNPDTSSPLISFTLPTLSVGTTNYSLAPAAPFTLQPGTTYWLVGSTSSSSNYGGWVASNPTITPTGLATFAGYRRGNPPTNPNILVPTFSIQATSVPGPLPLLGVGAAFGASRRLRRRLQASRSTPRTQI
jgi:hypothetical protein